MSFVQQFLDQLRDEQRLRHAHRLYRLGLGLAVTYWLVALAYGIAAVLKPNLWWFGFTAFFMALGFFWLWRARRGLKKTYWDLGQPFETRKGKGNGRYRRTGQVDRTGAGGGTGPGARPGGSAGMTANEADFAGLEFAPGEVFGSRAFKVDVLGRLTGVAYETVWRPGENIAECKMTNTLHEVKRYWPGIYEKLTGQTLHQAPPAFNPYPVLTIGTYSYATNTSAEEPPTEYDRQRVCDLEHDMEQCYHGFYGYYEGSNDYGDQGHVNGVIRGSGKTLIGSRGFRCAKAEIVALHIKSNVDAQLAARIRKNYPDIPFFDEYKTMIAASPPDPGENGLKGPDSPEFWDLKL